VTEEQSHSDTLFKQEREDEKSNSHHVVLDICLLLRTRLFTLLVANVTTSRQKEQWPYWWCWLEHIPGREPHNLTVYTGRTVGW